MKAPEVGGASVPAVLKEGQPGPHSRGPQAPFLGVIGFSKCRIDVFREDMEPPVEISLCASRQPALDIIATPFDPAVDLLDLSAKVAKLRQCFRLSTTSETQEMHYLRLDAAHSMVLEQIRRVSDSLARMEGEGGEESRNGVAIVLDLGGGRRHEGDGN